MNRSKRKPVSKKNVKTAFDLVEKQMSAKIAKRGMGRYESVHEIFGMLAEEFNRELLKAMHENHVSNFEEELVDICVCALWGIASVKALKEEGVYE